MNASWRQALSDYGMVFVLLVLCAVFSVLTFTEQSPTGLAAARQVAAQVKAAAGAPQVLIAVLDQPGEIAFAAQLRQELEAAGAQVIETIEGTPKTARDALQKIAASGGTLDAIACTPATGAWLVFSDLKTDFPALGDPQVVVPRSYRWPTFLMPSNLLNIANQIAVIAIIAIGMTMVIITGGIDLSVGSLLALAAVIAAWLIREAAGGLNAQPLGMFLACVASVGMCGAVGAFNCLMITRFNIPPFIVTLAVLKIASGLAFDIADGQSIYQIPESFVWLGRGADLFGLPNAVVLMLILYGLAHVVMSRMALGRYLYAVGGNREAARLSGLPVGRVLLVAYVASAMLAGLGGVIMASQLKSGSPTYGNTYELYVIAAVVVGGASLSGGQGKMLGTLIGALIIAVIQNGMNLTNIESFTQQIVLGAVILGAVVIDQLRRRRRIG